MEKRIQVLLLILLLNSQETLLRQLVLVGYGISVHDTYVMNTVHPYLSYLTDQQVSLLIQIICSHRWIVEK